MILMSLGLSAGGRPSPRSSRGGRTTTSRTTGTPSSSGACSAAAGARGRKRASSSSRAQPGSTAPSPRRRSRGCRRACVCSGALASTAQRPSPCTTTATSVRRCGRARPRRLLLHRRRVRARRCGRGSSPVQLPPVTPASGLTCRAVSVTHALECKRTWTAPACRRCRRARRRAWTARARHPQQAPPQQHLAVWTMRSTCCSGRFSASGRAAKSATSRRWTALTDASEQWIMRPWTAALVLGAPARLLEWIQCSMTTCKDTTSARSFADRRY